jgi:hypothetical protein
MVTQLCYLALHHHALAMLKAGGHKRTLVILAVGGWQRLTKSMINHIPGVSYLGPQGVPDHRRFFLAPPFWFFSVHFSESHTTLYHSSS